jgi:lactate dehydrogenase-like 2-hydroxyacid dehydrogenase
MSGTAKPVLLVLTPLPEQSLARLADSFEVHHAPTNARCAEVLRSDGARIRLVLTNGTVGLSPAQIDAMPALTFACALGAGYENLALDHARARGIVLANGAGTNDDSVADQAFALLLGSVRAVPQYDQACRQGVWRDHLTARPQLARKRLGIVGLGTIGRKIAQRGAGFEMAVGYHNRSPRADVAHTYFDNLVALAQWSDVLVVATPGGAGTRHLVDATVLKALGPGGFLVNIARGSIVDTDALAHALRSGELGGAGLDVYESEPLPPAALLELPNVVLSPHVGGMSPEAQAATLQSFLDNAALHLAGQPVRTPI